MFRAVLASAAWLAAVWCPAAALAEGRPYIYGCGITWGAWLGLPTDQAKQFDRLSMDKIVQMGGTVCPANFAWIDIEPSQGTYNWDYVDHQVNEALARGLTIFAYSGLTPDWALPADVLATYGSGIGYRFPPDDAYIPDFESFFQMLAARYRGKVKYYEFWNEPNGCSWINDDCANGNMAYTYVPWLQRWYTAMKQGDPDCVLSIGGLDYNAGVTNGYQYIEDIYANGGGPYFDAVAIHPYGSPLHWQAITDTYQVLLNHGDGHKKLWLNEYGWDTTDENAKASDLTTVLTQLKEPQYDMVFEANYLVLTDLPATPDSGHDFGLCDRNLTALTITPRQSWSAFQALDKIQIDFSAFPTSWSVAPASVQFTNRSYYPGASGWSWTFGDAQTSTQQNPAHTYTGPGTYTVQLTVTGPSGARSKQKVAYIQIGEVLPVPGVANPSFEDGGGSYAGWDIRTLVQGPDIPPLHNTSYYVTTPAGTHWGGKITSWMTTDFYLGQVVGTTDWDPYSTQFNWQLSALVQLRSTYNQKPYDRPTNVHEVWEIGWNDGGSEPVDIMSCDHYQTIASIDGAFTNNTYTFAPLSQTGTLAGVQGVRGVAIRVHMYNDYTYEWSYINVDDVSFVLTAVVPVVPGDFNGDGYVDGTDLAHLSGCRTGPGVGPASGCAEADLDGDGDVDQDDFGTFQRCYTGTGAHADPNCAN